MLHLARIAMLCSSQLRKINLSEARAVLDKAKPLLDDSMRIAKAILDHPKGNGNNLLKNKVPADGGKDDRTVFSLQSLHATGLLEVSKYELQEPKATHHVALETIHALRECISIYSKQGIQDLLRYPDVKAEYLSCLRHLMSFVSDYSGDGKDQSAVLQELKDDVKHIEEDLSDIRKNRR